MDNYKDPKGNPEGKPEPKSRIMFPLRDGKGMLLGYVDSSVLEKSHGETTYRIYQSEDSGEISDSEVFSRIVMKGAKPVEEVINPNNKKKQGKRFVGYYRASQLLSTEVLNNLRQIRDQLAIKMHSDSEIEIVFFKGKEDQVVYLLKDDPDRLLSLDGKVAYEDGTTIGGKGAKKEGGLSKSPLNRHVAILTKKILEDIGKQNISPQDLLDAINEMNSDSEELRKKALKASEYLDKVQYNSHGIPVGPPPNYYKEDGILSRLTHPRKKEKRDAEDSRYLSRVGQYVEQVVDAMQRRDNRKADKIRKQLKLFVLESDPSSRSRLTTKTINKWIAAEKDSREEQRYLKQAAQYVEQISEAIGQGKNDEAEKIRKQLYGFAERFDPSSQVFISKEKIDRWISAYTKPK